jgi:AcrR family transcriptional regulator
MQLRQGNRVSDSEIAYGSVKAGTIARLLVAGRHEFARYGYAAAKVDDIARSAGVTKQLVYHYYRDKEELFTCVLDDTAASVMPDLLSLQFSDLPPVEALRKFVNGIIDQFSADPLLGPLAVEGIRYHNDLASQGGFARVVPALTESLARILRRGIESGEFRSDVEPRALLGLVVLTTSGAFTSRYQLSAILGMDSTSSEGLDFWRKQAIAFVLNAILAPQKT